MALPKSAPGMAIRALAVGRVGGPFPSKLLMAAFAVLMKGDVQLPGVALSFRRIMAGGVLFDRLSFLPGILTVLIFMVALPAGLNLNLDTFQVGEADKSLSIDSINFIFVYKRLL
jgi:hypothetical protein